jgi:hypothetical protein
VSDNLDKIIQGLALRDFENASGTPDGPASIVREYRTLVESEYKNPRAVHDNINNFMIDSVRYHHMHAERDLNVSLDRMHLETIEYLARLINGYPMQERGFQEEWRKGVASRPSSGEAYAEDEEEDDGN